MHLANAITHISRLDNNRLSDPYFNMLIEVQIIKFSFISVLYFFIKYKDVKLFKIVKSEENNEADHFELFKFSADSIRIQKSELKDFLSEEHDIAIEIPESLLFDLQIKLFLTLISLKCSKLVKYSIERFKNLDVKSYETFVLDAVSLMINNEIFMIVIDQILLNV